jgi:putative nucleotidyltransferase with HDIG domain
MALLNGLYHKGLTMKEKIIELLPEINLIRDASLREKTLQIWEEAIKAGGWKVEDLNKIPFTLLIKDAPVSFLEHTRGVTKVCIAVADVFAESYGDRIPINRDYLIAGALLHDIGKLLEFTIESGNVIKSKSGRYLRHPFSGVAICFSYGIPDEVLHIIAVHSREGDGGWRSPEAIILHHADFTNFEPLK